MTSSFAEIKLILQKPLKSRSKPDILFLFSYFSSLSFCDSAALNEKNLLKICKYLQFTSFPASTFICKSGDPGDKFYIILRGQAEVLRSDDTTITLATLNEGDSFGEYALIYNQPRMASVRSSSEIDLAYLAKSDYLKFLGKFDRRKLENILVHLKKFSVLRNWTKNALVRFSYSLVEQQFHRKNIVFQEGENIENVYLVKEGEVELIKSIKRNSKKANKAHVSLVGPGEILGDEVLLENKYLYTCIVNSMEACFFVMKKKDFLNKIRDTESQVLVKKNCEFRENERLQRIKSLDFLGNKKTRDFGGFKTPRVEAETRKCPISPKVSVSPKVNYARVNGTNRLRIQLKKSGINWRSGDESSPVHVSVRGKVMEKRYLLPFEVESKSIR